MAVLVYYKDAKGKIRPEIVRAEQFSGLNVKVKLATWLATVQLKDDEEELGVDEVVKRYPYHDREETSKVTEASDRVNRPEDAPDTSGGV